MVRLRKTASLTEKLKRLAAPSEDASANTGKGKGKGKASRDGLAKEMPLELLDAVQQHLANAEQQDWVDHGLLARIAKWNRTLERKLAGWLAS